MAVAMIGPKFYAWDDNGNPLALGKLYTYQTQTNTPKPTYQGENQVTENTNPVILNGEGYATVYLDGSYNMVLKDENDNEIWTQDPVSSSSAQEWIACQTATYLSPTSFKVDGDSTDLYTAGRRIRIDNGVSVFSYSTIDSAVFSGSETTVTLIDAVVLVGVQSACISIVSINSFGSSFTVQQAKTLPLSVGQEIKTSGYNTVNDGGGADYVVVAGGTGADDGGSYHNMDNSNQLMLIPSDTISPRIFGASNNAVCTDNIQNLIIFSLSKGITIRSSKETYIVESLQITDSIEWIGNNTELLAVDGATSSQIILNIEGVDNVYIEGIKFNGNTDNVTSFNTVIRVSSSSNVTFQKCHWENCRGIACIVSAGSIDTTFDHCTALNCGIYNRTSGMTADRRQAFAFTGSGSGSVVKYCTFENVGLDCISFATGEDKPKAIGNKIFSNDAGSIYVSNCTNFEIRGNIVNNDGGGNAIDVPSSNYGIIDGNICFGNGAAGILIAEDSSNILVSNNISYNNVLSGTATTHQGGITLFLNNPADEMSSITLDNNQCYDNQGVGNVTQRYALDINNSAGGDFKNILINDNNYLEGYNSGGNYDFTSIVRQSASNTDCGSQPSMVFENWADNEVKKACSLTECGLIEIQVINSTDYVSFAIYNGGVNIVSDPAGIGLVSDAGVGVAVYSDGSNIVIKNRLGLTRSIGDRMKYFKRSSI